MSYTRTLSFSSHDLGRDATLVLVFNAQSPDLSPVVWKVARFRAQGAWSLNVTFSGQFAWIKPVITAGSIVTPLTYTAIHPSQVTTLQEDGSGAYSFTTPEEGSPGYVSVVNGTNKVHDIALGFLPPENPAPVPVSYRGNLPASGTINTDFRPILRAYVTDLYKEGEIVRGEVSSPAIFEQNLAALGDKTFWGLNYSREIGIFSINQL